MTPQVKKKKTASTLTSKMVEAYIPLVHSIASMVSAKGLPPGIDYNDLVSDGMIGLMKAWERFDPSRGVKFETYASYRIRGSILDGLKIYNPVPYRVQVMVRDLAKKGYRSLLGKQDLIIERQQKKIADEGLSEEEFKAALSRIQKIISASALMYLLSLENLGEMVDVPTNEITPADELEFKELQGRLVAALDTLPEDERKVVHLFYKQEMSQKDIAAKLRLSRPKVNRLLARAITRLREQLRSGGEVIATDD